MIHYHGGPVTPESAAIALWTGRHGVVSFAYMQQVETAFEVCQSVIFDSGAFTHWKRGTELDLPGYAGEIRRWERHPAYDFHLIPDDVDGGEAENDLLLAKWRNFGLLTLDGRAVPVWHMHESIARLQYLCHAYPRVALGSSGAFKDVGTPSWVLPGFTDRSKPLESLTFRQQFKKVVERAGITYGRDKAQGVTFHTLRHTFASHAVMRGVDLYTVAQLLGDSLAVTEATYSHLSRDFKALAIAKVAAAFTVPDLPEAA